MISGFLQLVVSEDDWRVIEASEFFISYSDWPTLILFLLACLHIVIDQDQFLVPFLVLFQGILTGLFFSLIQIF